MTRERTYADPRTLGANCAACPLAKHGAPNLPTLGVGPASPAGLLVGDAPSKEDAEKGRPFTGQVGEALDQSLAKAGIPRGRLFVVNSVCCPPKDKKDLEHLKKAVDACRPAFLAQVTKYLNLPTLALGKWALYAMTGRVHSIEKARGFVRALEPFSQKE